jgi:hypothetical protein
MMANFEGMAGGVASSSSSPMSQCILARSRGARQVDSSALVSISAIRDVIDTEIWKLVSPFHSLNSTLPIRVEGRVW